VEFEKSISQNELGSLVREIVTGRAGGESEPGFDPALWRELAKAGVLSAALPETLGGAGLGLLEQCSVLVELGRTLAPAPYLASALLGAGAIAEFGTADQRQRWAEPAGRGELVLTAALAEDGAEDPRAPSATATRLAGDASTPHHTLATGGGGAWVMSGVKTTVAGAPWADAVLVPASTPDGVRVFVVERSDEGVTIEPQELTDGVTAGRVTLDAVKLSSDRELGGGDVADWLAARGTVGLCALQLGVTERAVELTAEYARNRVQFARPIGSFQAVAQRLADAWIDVEAIRLTMWQAAWRLSAGLSRRGGEYSDTAIATAKFWAADAGHRVAHTAVHIHGGVGIDISYPLHRYFAAAKHNEFALGGATTQLRRIGVELAKALHRTKNTYTSFPTCTPGLRSRRVDSSRPPASPTTGNTILHLGTTCLGRAEFRRLKECACFDDGSSSSLRSR
jgi:alkylation response protein AidB-like acyl-CoA dehydrogenase